MKLRDINENIILEKALSMDEVTIYPIKNNTYAAEFMVGDYTIRLEIHLTTFDHELSVNSDGSTITDARILFNYKDKNGKTGYDMLNVGFGFAKTIVDTIVVLVRDFFIKYDNYVDIVSYTANGRGRIAVYDRISREVSSNGYIDLSKEANEEYDGTFSKVYLFVRRDVYSSLTDADLDIIIQYSED